MKGKLEDQKMAAMQKTVWCKCFKTVTAKKCKIFQSRKFCMCLKWGTHYTFLL